MRQLSVLTSTLIVLAVSVACIHKTGGSVTPWERIHTYNAALAEANNAVEQGAEITVTSGLASANQVAPLINWTGQVALLHQQITSILAQGQATQANIASVKALVDVVKRSASTLPPAALGLKNSRTQQAFSLDVENIGRLADSILSSFAAIGGTS